MFRFHKLNARFICFIASGTPNKHLWSHLWKPVQTYRVLCSVIKKEILPVWASIFGKGYHSKKHQATEQWRVVATFSQFLKRTLIRFKRLFTSKRTKSSTFRVLPLNPVVYFCHAAWNDETSFVQHEQFRMFNECHQRGLKNLDAGTDFRNRLSLRANEALPGTMGSS